MFSANSLNFVPGSRPEWFAKARAAGAGLTVIDLEDAVPSDRKDEARAHALEAVESDPAFGLRINGVLTEAGGSDLAALAQAQALPSFLLVPMVETVEELAQASEKLAGRCPGLIPLIETPRGLRHALGIASAKNVAAVMFGGGDFSAELGVALAWEPLLAARQQLILACAEARIPAIDVPFIHLDDDAGLQQECNRSRTIGFACKAAIHPKQVPVINKAFAPSETEISEAQEALAAFDAAGGKAIRHKGRMLEVPIIKHYRAILARSEGTSNA